MLNGKTFDRGENMKDVYQWMRVKGLPYKVEVSDQCKHIVSWCLKQQPFERPTCQQLLDFLTNAHPTHPLRSHRSEFTSLDNKPHATTYEHKKIMTNSPGIGLVNLKKEDILKVAVTDRRVKPVLSNYEQYRLMTPKAQ